jgi:hypothetical protein
LRERGGEGRRGRVALVSLFPFPRPRFDPLNSSKQHSSPTHHSPPSPFDPPPPLSSPHHLSSRGLFSLLGRAPPQSPLGLAAWYPPPPLPRRPLLPTLSFRALTHSQPGRDIYTHTHGHALFYFYSDEKRTQARRRERQALSRARFQNTGRDKKKPETKETPPLQERAPAREGPPEAGANGAPGKG